MFDVKVYPRSDLRPEQFKQLWAALLAWQEQQDYYRDGAGMVAHVEGPGMQDLLAGRMVRPFLQKVIEWEQHMRRETRVPLMTPAEQKHLRSHLFQQHQLERHVLHEMVVRCEVLTERDAKVFCDWSGDWIVKQRRPGGPPEDFARTVASLRQFVPQDLVTDVLIDGKSWNILPDLAAEGLGPSQQRAVT